jgi:glycerophosphoryl diester phosphodiesterase
MIRIISHRGKGSSDAGENTLEALETALRETGGIETDVSASRDGVPYLIHDVSFYYIPGLRTASRYVLRKQLDASSRFWMNERRIDEVFGSTVDTQRLKNGARIPKLSELFSAAAQYPRSTLNLELKGENSAAPALAALEEAIAARQVARGQILLTSFDAAALDAARRHDPMIKCGLLMLPPSARSAWIYPWSRTSQSRYAPFGAAALADPLVQKIRPDYFVLTPGAATKANIALVNAAYPGARLILWTPREKLPARNKALHRALADPAVKAQIDAVITNYPAEMQALLYPNGPALQP